jgi:hypothetical protein
MVRRNFFTAVVIADPVRGVRCCCVLACRVTRACSRCARHQARGQGLYALGMLQRLVAQRWPVRRCVRVRVCIFILFACLCVRAVSQCACA